MTVEITLATVNGAITSAKNALDLLGIVRKLLSAPDHQEIATAKEKLSEIKEALLTTKEALFALRQDNIELKQRLLELERQDRNREGLSLRSIAPGAFAYVLDAEPETLKSGPWFCQHCLEAGNRMVLQLAQRDFGRDFFKCPACGSQVQVPNQLRAEIVTVPRPDIFKGYL